MENVPLDMYSSKRRGLPRLRTHTIPARRMCGNGCDFPRGILGKLGFFKKPIDFLDKVSVN